MSDYAGQAREYLTYCAEAAAELRARGSALDAKHHPAADGAVKMIPHGGDPGKAKVIRQAFHEITTGEAS